MTAANTTLFLQRDTKIFVTEKANAKAYEIPALEGLSFSQSVNNATVTLNEASPDGNTQRRGSAAFAESLAPAEWSFQTYLRPTLEDNGGNYVNGDRDDGNKHGAIEEILWAALAGDLSATDGNSTTFPADGSNKDITGWTFGTTNATLDFASSNKLQLAKLDMFFALSGMGTASDDNLNVIYHLDEAVVNEVSIDFDIDGIATCTWSGFAKKIAEVTGGARPDSTTAGYFQNISANNVITATPNGDTVTAQNTSTSNFIQNRLSEVVLATNSGTDPNTNYLDAYTVTLTGGSITISNNISYVTPSMMQTVNQPLGHVVGSRTVSGNLTCYADSTAGRSIDLYEDLQEASVFDATNMFDMRIYLGGKASAFLPNGPGALFFLPAAHIDIPTHNIEDVISFDIGFTGLASNGVFAVNASTGVVTQTTAVTATNSLTATNELLVVMTGA
tara:strand:- start:3860 stop:5200 length:1341 start_codon:yes stop_codon:yes gene_type:complete